MRKHLTLLAFTLLGTAHAQSLLENYHPFPKASRIPVETCQRSQPTELQTVLSCSRVQVTQNLQNPEEFDLSPEVLLDLPRGIQLSVKMDLIPHFLGEAYQTDLNGDNRTDVIVTLPWGGNGLGSERSVVVFAISDGETYQLSAIDSLSFNPSALIRRNGQNQILHTAFVNTKSIDGKNHSFFVYNTLKIENGLLKLDPAQEKVWIQYKYRPNSVPTKLLTPWQKQQGWTEYLKWTSEDRMTQGIFRKVQ